MGGKSVTRGKIRDDYGIPPHISPSTVDVVHAAKQYTVLITSNLSGRLQAETWRNNVGAVLKRVSNSQYSSTTFIRGLFGLNSHLLLPRHERHMH